MTTGLASFPDFSKDVGPFGSFIRACWTIKDPLPSMIATPFGPSLQTTGFPGGYSNPSRMHATGLSSSPKNSPYSRPLLVLILIGEFIGTSLKGFCPLLVLELTPIALLQSHPLVKTDKRVPSSIALGGSLFTHCNTRFSSLSALFACFLAGAFRFVAI